MSKLVEFYRNEIPNFDGYYLDDILGWSHENFEQSHTHIQWIFPTKTVSHFYPEMPVLDDDDVSLFAADPELKEKAKQAFLKGLDFYGMKLTSENPIQVEFQQPGESHRDPHWWLRRFNHNFLRMTRFITSLRLLGLPEYSKALSDHLLSHTQEFDLSEETRFLWHDAYHGKLS